MAKKVAKPVYKTSLDVALEDYLSSGIMSTELWEQVYSWQYQLISDLYGNPVQNREIVTERTVMFFEYLNQENSPAVQKRRAARRKDKSKPYEKPKVSRLMYRWSKAFAQVEAICRLRNLGISDPCKKDGTKFTNLGELISSGIILRWSKLFLIEGKYRPKSDEDWLVAYEKNYKVQLNDRKKKTILKDVHYYEQLHSRLNTVAHRYISRSDTIEDTSAEY